MIPTGSGKEQSASRRSSTASPQPPDGVHPTWRRRCSASSWETKRRNSTTNLRIGQSRTQLPWIEGCDCKLLNPLTDINGIRVLSRLGRPTRSSRAPTDMIPTRAPSRAPFTVAVGITSGPRTCSRAPVGSKTRRRDMPGGTVSTFAQNFFKIPLAPATQIMIQYAYLQ